MEKYNGPPMTIQDAYMNVDGAVAEAKLSREERVVVEHSMMILRSQIFPKPSPVSKPPEEEKK